VTLIEKWQDNSQISVKDLSAMNWSMFSVFLLVFVTVSALGFWAARWRSSDLNRIQEWGLAGRRFGIIMAWFLLGGDVYTAHVLIAIPGLIFGKGALGFYIIPYHILLWPIIFMTLPRFWILARHRGYVTAGDFVRERFGSQTLALLIALTGILATMPYIALQILGMEVVLSQMGVPVEFALIIAFVVLAAFTYFGGLRAPALMSMVKDVLIWFVVLVAFIYIPTRLGGLQHIFSAIPSSKLTLPADQYSAYATLAIGSALALFLYPHTLTGMLSINSHKVVKRTTFLLPINTILLGLLSLLGYVAIVAGVQSSPTYGTNVAIPALFGMMFPAWFAGFAFAAITIGALVPASIMSIAASSLFSRNIYRVYFRPSCSEEEEAKIAKIASLVVKFGALLFVLTFPTYTFANNLQLLGGVWIMQTLPAVFIGLFTNWFHRYALITGWIVGMVAGTWMVLTQNFASVFPLHIGSVTLSFYAALIAVLINLFLSWALTPLFHAMHIPAGHDLTSPIDYEAHPISSELTNLPDMSQVSTPMPAIPPLQSLRPIKSREATRSTPVPDEQKIPSASSPMNTPRLSVPPQVTIRTMRVEPTPPSPDGKDKGKR
jgi:solute:Na+ symporter, SSS family